MNHKMRRSDRMLTDDAAIDILKKCSYGILSTIGENGYPYGIPVNYVYINNCIYFHCFTKEGHKLRNIEYNPNVCFTVVGKAEVLPSKFSTDYESTIVFGKAEKVNSQEKHSVLEAIIDKFSPDFKQSGMKYISNDIDKVDIIKIIPQQITGKANN